MKFKVLADVGKLTHDEWLNLRRTGIGGSDAGAIMGASRYATPYSVWAEKRGLVQSDFVGNEATELGIALETPIAEIYAKRTGARVVRFNKTIQGKLDFQVGNVDFFIMGHEDYPAGQVTTVDVLDHEPLAILEIKTAALAGHGNHAAWDDDGVPESYYWQGAHYASITQVHDVVFCCLLGGAGLQIREVAYDAETLDRLERAEESFWHLVKSGDEPELLGKQPDFQTLKAMFPTSTDEVVQVDDFVADLVDEYRAAREAANKAEAELQQLRAQLERIIGQAQSVECEGRMLYTYKSTKTGETLDVSKLRDEAPEVYAKYVKPKAGFRVLRVKGE